MDGQNAISAMLVSSWSITLPLLAGLFCYRGFRDIRKYLFALVLFSLLVEVSANYIGRWLLHSNNLPLLHLFSVVQFTFLWLIFGKRIVPPFPKRTFHILLFAFYTFALLCAIWIDGIVNFNAYARSFGALLIIFFCLVYYFQRLKMLDLENLEKDPLFWIATGSLIYFSGSIMLFIVSNYILDNEGMSISMWGIHAVLNTFNNIFYAIALWVVPKRLG